MFNLKENLHASTIYSFSMKDGVTPILSSFRRERAHMNTFKFQSLFTYISLRFNYIGKNIPQNLLSHE